MSCRCVVYEALFGSVHRLCRVQAIERLWPSVRKARKTYKERKKASGCSMRLRRVDTLVAKLSRWNSATPSS
jgi:hypothetical protein